MKPRRPGDALRAFANGRSAMLAMTFIVLAGSTAHASPEKAAKFYENALQRYEAEDLAGAAVQLKNAIQEDKRNLAAHVLFGKVLLRSGELKGAEAAFEEALRQGVSRSEVAVFLGQIFLQLDEGKKLLEQITVTGLPPTVQAEVLTLRGSAHAMSGNFAAASQSFAEARQLDPLSAGPLLSEAPILLRAGERDRAKATALKATQLAPKSFGTWYVLGTVLQVLQDVPGAMAAFDKALALNGNHVDSRVSRATLLMGMKRNTEAERELVKLKDEGAEEPRASYLRATLASARGDSALAKTEYADAAALIDAMAPGIRSANEPLLLTGALAHRALGNREKAREYLETMLARNARHYGGQMLLASVLIDSREYARAVSLLESLRRTTPEEPQVLYLLGTVYMARKQYAQASELFELAAARSSGTDAMRELGLSQIGLGQDKTGIATIEKAFAKNPNDLRAGIELAMIYTRQGQAAKALKAAELVVKNDPANLTMLNFLGNIKGRIGDKRGAREAFQQVLAKDPTLRVASINLNWLDIEERRYDEARARIQQILVKRPDDPDLLYQLGTLELRTHHLQEAINQWQRANAVQRQDPRPGLATVDLLLSQRVNDQALTAAKTLANTYPNNLLVQISLSRAYLGNGNTALARQTLAEANRLANVDPDQQVLIGRLQLAAGNPDGATYNATKALQSRADDLGAMVLLVEIEARKNSPAMVDAALKALSAKHPAAVATLLTTGHVAMSRGKFSAAQASYRQAMEKEPSTAGAILLAHAHIAANEADKALAALEGWAKRNPNDRTALKALAEVQVLAGKDEGARKSYSQILAADPDDATTLSSLALLQQRLGDPAAATTADRSVKLEPGNARFTDVLGWILVQQGNLEVGVRQLREARLRDPNNGLIRYHLAFALAKAGRKAEAKDEMSAALSAAPKVAPSPEMTRLKVELGL